MVTEKKKKAEVVMFMGLTVQDIEQYLVTENKKAEVVIFMGLTVQDIEQYLVTENKKEAEVVNVRLENIKLKNKLKKKEQQLKSKVMPLTAVGRSVQTQQ